MADLEQWMTDNKETDESLAGKLGISRVSVTRIRNGVHGASKKTALRLEAITGFPWFEFIGPVEQPSEPAETEAAQ